MKKKIIELIVCIAICLGVGALGSVFTTPAIGSWYAYLEKPAFNPPNWIFAPVWTILYILMGIAIFLVYQARNKKKSAKPAIVAFIVHLLFNLSWSLVFFGARMIALGFENIAILWLLVAFLVVVFWRIDKRASILLWPYLAWVSFATVLNYYICILNVQ